MPDGHTTNLTVVDAEGCACVLTTSLGLGTGDFLPGLDLHLNSMLGEVDLHHVPLEAGARMESMMAPSLAFDDDGLVLAIGSAGGRGSGRRSSASPLRSSTRGSSPSQRSSEPGSTPSVGSCTPSPASTTARSHSWRRRDARVRRWPAQHHYFGGVSAVGRSGCAGDPRRSGHAAALR